MYEEFYGLIARPFSKTPDPGFLFLSMAHEEALARLQYAVEEKEIIMLTGEVGCGKTTLTRALVDSLDERFQAVFVLNPALTANQMLRLLARRFGLEVPGNFKEGILEALHERLYEYYETGVTPVVIVDEAQLIPRRETFEELRLLTNFQLDDANLLSLVLVGQPGLRRRMEREAYRPFRQRVGLFYHLEPLDEGEAMGYIRHRLSVAGRTDPLFSEGAMRLIHRHSGGVPRLINSIANTALIEGLGVERDFIDETLVESAVRELGLANGGRR